MRVLRLSLLVLLMALGGLVYWTQTLARTYGYHPALGPPLWELRPWHGLVYPLYAPWQALVWQWQWGEPWLTWVVFGSLGLGLGLALAGWWWHVTRPGQPPPLEGHGTTRWASMKNVKRAGLL